MFCGLGRWLGIPPPCPVDDTPFTACTSADAALRQSLTPGAFPAPPLVIHVPLPSGLVVRAPAAPPPLESTAVEFTTKTYERAKHGRGARRGR